MLLADLLTRLAHNTLSSVVEIGMEGQRRELSFPQLYEKVNGLRNRLTRSGFKHGNIIAIHATNSIDYIAWDIAVASLNGILLAIPEDPDRCTSEFIFNQNHAVLLASDSYAGPNCTHVVTLDDARPELPLLWQTENTNSADLHSKVFSSGTTGNLKGINISRAGTEYIVSEFIDTYGLNERDRHLIFLPFSNYQQRMSVYGCLYAGCSIVLAPYQKVFQAIKTERPSFLIAPPVFFDTALQLWQQTGMAAPLLDFLGGNIRFLITGMAPAKLKTLEAYWQNGLSLYEAYGLTETGMVTWNSPHGCRLGSVGRPLNRDHIAFADDGEIIIDRPYPLSIGYFGVDAAEVRHTFTPLGILTGDFGTFDENGFLFLKGRKKDLIILNNGKKFHPYEVEDHIRRNTPVKEVIVAASTDGSRVMAIVPTGSNYIAPKEEDEIRKYIVRSNSSLEPHKRVSYVIFTELDVFRDSRFITRNLKLNRSAVLNHFS